MSPDQIREIMLAFPPSSAPASPGPVKSAIYALANDPDRPFDGENAKAAAWLLERVKVWASSVVCKKLLQNDGKNFRPCLARWMREEMYDTPDECWGVGVTVAKPVQAWRDTRPKEPPRADLPRSLRLG